MADRLRPSVLYYFLFLNHALCGLATTGDNFIGSDNRSLCCCSPRSLLVDGLLHRILDNQTTCSSIWGPGHESFRGKLFHTVGNSAWVPGETDPDPWIQFDLGRVWTILAFVTRGRHDLDQWTTSYRAKYALTDIDYNAGNWTYAMNRPAPEITLPDASIFIGNHDRATFQVNWLSQPIKAQYVRISPLTANGRPKAIRADMIGCLDN